MGELEEKLNNILSSPADMEKIMSIARSFSAANSADEQAPEIEDEKGGGLSALASSLGDFDPKILGIVSRIFGEYSSNKKGKSDLLSAIQPYLKPERREQVDKATEMAKMAKLAKIAFSEFRGGDGSV